MVRQSRRICSMTPALDDHLQHTLGRAYRYSHCLVIMGTMHISTQLDTRLLVVRCKARCASDEVRSYALRLK